MDKNLIYKKIDNCIEERRSIWTIVIVLSGGLAGLMLSFSGFSLTLAAMVKFILFFIGFIFDCLFITSIGLINKKINKYFDLLQKESAK